MSANEKAQAQSRPALITGLIFTIALAGLAFLTLGPSAHGQGSSQTHIVEISGFEFQPADLTVRKGDTIIWINRDPAPHTATAEDGAFDSGSMSLDDEWSFVADTEGAFDYLCTFHPQMTGSITVEAS